MALFDPCDFVLRYLWSRRPCQGHNYPDWFEGTVKGARRAFHLDPWQFSRTKTIERGTKRNEVQWSFVP